MKIKLINGLIALSLLASSLSAMERRPEVEPKEIASQMVTRAIEIEHGDARKAFENFCAGNYQDDEQLVRLDQLLTLTRSERNQFFARIYAEFANRGLKFKNAEIAEAIALREIDLIKVMIRNGEKNSLNKPTDLLELVQKKLNDSPANRHHYLQIKQLLQDEIGNRSLSRMVWKAAGGAVVVGGLVWLGNMLYKKYQEWKAKQQGDRNNVASGSLSASAQISAPSITNIKWGETVVSHNGQEHVYRDAKLWPGHSKEWDWNEHGTRHNPGTQISDLAEFIDEVDVVILSKGMDLVLKVPQATINYAQSKGKQVHTGETKQMVKLYNKLVREGKKVGGLFHSTC